MFFPPWPRCQVARQNCIRAARIHLCAYCSVCTANTRVVCSPETEGYYLTILCSDFTYFRLLWRSLLTRKGKSSHTDWDWIHPPSFLFFFFLLNNPLLLSQQGGLCDLTCCRVQESETNMLVFVDYNDTDAHWVETFSLFPSILTFWFKSFIIL